MRILEDDARLKHTNLHLNYRQSLYKDVVKPQSEPLDSQVIPGFDIRMTQGLNQGPLSCCF